MPSIMHLAAFCTDKMRDVSPVNAVMKSRGRVYGLHANGQKGIMQQGYLRYISTGRVRALRSLYVMIPGDTQKKVRGTV